MAQFIHCDRCDKQKQVTGTDPRPMNWGRVTMETNVANQFIGRDLCDTCIRDFKKFVEPLPQSAES